MSDPVAVDQVTEFASTPLERYFARRAHGQGMVFEVRLALSGSLDTARLSDCWRATAAQHPRLCSKLAGAGRKRRWVPHRVPSFDLVASDQLHAPEITEQGIADLANSNGCHLAVVQSGENQWELVWRFHHACCDGVGAGRVIADVLKRYAQSRRLVAQHEDARTLTDSPTSTQSAVRPASSDRKPVPASPRGIPDLGNFWLTIRGSNARLDRYRRSSSALEEETSPYLALASHDSDRLRRRLREMRVPLNDFAVAMTSIVLARLTSKQASRRRHVMIMNPVQMRSWADRRDSANHIGFAFIRRHHDELKDLGEVIASTHRQMNDVRKHGFAAELVDGLSLIEGVPGAIRLTEKLGWFTPTASLTCLSGFRFGRRFGFDRSQGRRIGQARVDQLRILAPLQAEGQLAVTIWDTGDEVALSFRHAAGNPVGQIKQTWHDVLERFLSSHVGGTAKTK
ncbi:MAG: hypothetical protein AAGA03_04575 [Planctomycetota bacterium]